MTKLYSRWMTALTIAVLLVGILPLILDERAQLGEKLCLAAMSCNCAQIGRYLNMGADINTRDKSGQTAMIWAAVKGDGQAAQMLLERGADVNARNFQGDSALMWAALMGHEEVVQVLLEYNPDVNFRSKKKRVTALMAAAAKGHSNVVRLLISYGAEVDAKDENENTALMHATTKRFPEVVESLLSAGASYRGSKPSYTLSAWVFLSPEGEFEGLEFYRMGDVRRENEPMITDAYLWMWPLDVSVVQIMEQQRPPCFLRVERESAIGQVPPI
ncbi:MAG: ankyrin repeat domain-containing protein [Desulfomonile tiedjei]|uniref:Ankyrin repeat domain-containing protein n=1 Tax=Desulfomonile tiedjei TaxID=2358 RepID=A0A9D6Z4H6_9BACT|nr:ankyrin repeat domain-containing protein [Desulfomonile tiedjei]